MTNPWRIPSGPAGSRESSDPLRASHEMVRRLQDEIAHLELPTPPDQMDADIDARGAEAHTPSGTGAAMEGKVRITVTAGHVSEVVLEPRALRTPSEELAAAIRDATNAAIDDQNARVAAGLPDVPSLADLTATLDDVSAESLRAMEASTRGLRDAIAAVQRISEIHRRDQG
jgi:hypothetical protein